MMKEQITARYCLSKLNELRQALQREGMSQTVRDRLEALEVAINTIQEERGLPRG